MSLRSLGVALTLMAVGGAWLGIAESRATSLEPMNLATLTARSNQIVVGMVRSVKQGTMGSLTYLDVEVEVSETLRGAAQSTIRFRQLDPQSVSAAANGRRYLGSLPGMPHYTAGEQVVLFLGKPTASGFRTTIGLQQGKFTLGAGNAENESNNRGLFRGVGTGTAPLSVQEQSMLATSQGAVRSEALLGLMRRAIAGRWWDPVAAPPSGKGGPGRKPVFNTNDGEVIR